MFKEVEPPSPNLWQFVLNTNYKTNMMTRFENEPIVFLSPLNCSRTVEETNVSIKEKRPVSHRVMVIYVDDSKEIRQQIPSTLEIPVNPNSPVKLKMHSSITVQPVITFQGGRFLLHKSPFLCGSFPDSAHTKCFV